jgi:hypothetical protein
MIANSGQAPRDMASQAGEGFIILERAFSGSEQAGGRF